MQLAELNQLPVLQLKEQLLKCCGSLSWVEAMASHFPFHDKKVLFKKASEVWNNLTGKDWLEAFQHHPKIGDISSLKEKFANTANWASGEQASVQNAAQETIKKLAEGNRIYEEKFGYIFIVCATGKSAEEMLQLLQTRLLNSEEKEIKLAAEEQGKITKIRLEKLLA